MKLIRLNRLRTALAAAIFLAATAARAAEMQAIGVPGGPSAADSKHRSHLPMPNTVRLNLITSDAKDPDTKSPPTSQLRPPLGAPNVLIVLIDDAGFGSSNAFTGTRTFTTC